jgi:hypothetical protein
MVIQAALAQECKLIKDRDEALACYQGRERMQEEEATKKALEAKKKQDEDKKKEQEAKKDFINQVTLRDSIGERAKEPASISLTRSDGNTDYAVKAGLTLNLGRDLLLPFFGRGWSSYVAAAVNRNTLSSKEANFKALEYGATGSVFDLSAGFSLATDLLLNVKEDRVKDTLSRGAAVDSILILREKILEHGIPYSDQYAYFVFPRAGLYFDDYTKVAAGDTPGEAWGGHIGVYGSFYPGGALWRVKLYGEIRRAIDLHASSGLERRASTYKRIGIDYAFLDPRSKPPAVVPSLGLERVVGGFFLDGTDTVSQTVLMFKLKIN